MLRRRCWLPNTSRRNTGIRRPKSAQWVQVEIPKLIAEIAVGCKPAVAPRDALLDGIQLLTPPGTVAARGVKSLAEREVPPESSSQARLVVGENVGIRGRADYRRCQDSLAYGVRGSIAAEWIERHGCSPAGQPTVPAERRNNARIGGEFAA